MTNLYALLFLVLLATSKTCANPESDCNFLNCNKIARYHKVCARHNYSTYCWCVRDRSNGKDRMVRISVPCPGPSMIFNPKTGGCTRDTPQVRQNCREELRKWG
uniref:Putative 9.7 kDa salivary protein n=1 Tax=Culex tarsalis TaxID=7177 RepID=A0A1Q3EUW0_CULTA